MKISNDTKERIRVFFLLCLEIYKIICGCFLSLFVPHNCPGEETECVAVSASPTTFSTATIWVNGVTFFSIFVLYVTEISRENFCIHHFDVCPSLPDNNLKSEAPEEVFVLLNRWNQKYYWAALCGMVLTIANVAVSTVFLMYFHYRNTSTLTTLLSFSLLVCMKLFRSYSMAIASRRESRAYSAYLTEYTSFNTLDHDVYPPVEDNQI
jgi:hypothetical protein